MKNLIYLRRQTKVIVVKENHQVSYQELATLLKNIHGFGYTLSPQVLEIIQTFSKESLNIFYRTLEKGIRKMLGANVKYKPMYPNFPKQVMDMDEAQLYLNAMVHYLGDIIGTRFLADYKKEKRTLLQDEVKLKVIDLGTESDFRLMIRNLIGANTSISVTDQQDVSFAIRHYQDEIETILPDAIPQKENLAFVTELLLEFSDSGEDFLAKLFKTATDVLRLAVVISGGDVSLAVPTKFIKFKRSQRRLILSALENSDNIIEDMIRYKNEWIRIGEIIHPGEYINRYPKAFIAFDVIRNDKPFETFNGTVERLFREGRIEKSLNYLVKRPGELARRLDFLIRNIESYKLVTNEFKKVADKISTPVLLQVMTHFKHRKVKDEKFRTDLTSTLTRLKKTKKERPLRVFFPKGQVGKAVAIVNNLPLIHRNAARTIVKICEFTLVDRFMKLPDLGNVYLDPLLKNYLVPFSQRSANKSLRTLVRGSKVAMPIGDTIRFFLWWKEGVKDGVKTKRVDIDLSSVMFDANWKYKEHISYTNLKSSQYNAAHSGDITSAPDGACEFIDIDIPSVLKYGGRYVVMNVYSYTQQTFNTLPECFAGWMIRKSPNSGEIFEPKTVKDKLDLTAKTKVCIPVILDLEKRQMIWTDIALKSNAKWRNNLETNQRGVSVMGKAMTDLKKTSLYDLFRLHMLARGREVKHADEADAIFSIEKGITPFDMEKIMGEYLV